MRTISEERAGRHIDGPADVESIKRMDVVTEAFGSAPLGLELNAILT